MNVLLNEVDTFSLPLQGGTILLWPLILELEKRLISTIGTVESLVLKQLLQDEEEMNNN